MVSWVVSTQYWSTRVIKKSLYKDLPYNTFSVSRRSDNPRDKQLVKYETRCHRPPVLIFNPNNLKSGTITKDRSPFSRSEKTKAIDIDTLFLRGDKSIKLPSLLGRPVKKTK